MHANHRSSGAVWKLLLMSLVVSVDVRSEVLRSLRHYLRAQSQRRPTIDHQEKRGVERGSTRRSSFRGWERAIVSQTNIGTVSKATLGKLLRDWVERIWAFPSAYIPSWANLNSVMKWETRRWISGVGWWLWCCDTYQGYWCGTW